MEQLDVFTVRELRQRTGDLLRDAENGRLALITKHGRPAFLAVPFDDRLLKRGVNRALALHLFQAGHVTLSQAARIAILSIEDFLDLLGEFGIPAVDYPPEDLDEGLEGSLCGIGDMHKVIRCCQVNDGMPNESMNLACSHLCCSLTNDYWQFERRKS